MKKAPIKKMTENEINELVYMVDSLYPKTTRRENAGEWDKKSPRTIFWDHTQVFASKDPVTGSNRESYIKVTEGLHDGYLEIILRTPANFLNFKVRPALGQLEAYHDNFTKVEGETHMNYHCSAYMGKEPLVYPTPETEDDGMADWLTSTGIRLSKSSDNDGCDCDCHNKKEDTDGASNLDDYNFYGEPQRKGPIWTEEDCENFFNFLTNPKDYEANKKDEEYDIDEGVVYDNDEYGEYEDEDDCIQSLKATLLSETGIVVGDMIKQVNWPDGEYIIITEIAEEDGWNYHITFENQNGIIRHGILGKQLLNTWVLLN